VPRALSSLRRRHPRRRREPLPQHGVRQVGRPRVDTHEVSSGRQRPDRLPDDRSEPPPPAVPLHRPADGPAHGVGYFHALAHFGARNIEDLDRGSVASVPRPPQLAKARVPADALDACPHADRRARPFRRRAARIARPALVAMRCRKPCFLARRRLLGWNVLFMALSSSPSSRGRPPPPAHERGMLALPPSLRGTALPTAGGSPRLGRLVLPSGTTMPSLDHSPFRPHLWVSLWGTS
jgi:hypothetical protein